MFYEASEFVMRRQFFLYFPSDVHIFRPKKLAQTMDDPVIATQSSYNEYCNWQSRTYYLMSEPIFPHRLYRQNLGFGFQIREHIL